MRMRFCLAGLVASAALLSPVAASAQDINFIVFFDSGSAKLSVPARAIIDNVVAILAQERYNTTLLGHADQAGASDYNWGLACRRARAVRAYLVSRGIPASRLAVQSGGEDYPLVDTPEGAAEPQNRNVQFVFGAPRLTRADGIGGRGCVPMRF